jgi:hypothetical protein
LYIIRNSENSEWQNEELKITLNVITVNIMVHIHPLKSTHMQVLFLKIILVPNHIALGTNPVPLLDKAVSNNLLLIFSFTYEVGKLTLISWNSIRL